jgi:aminopeptidase N
MRNPAKTIVLLFAIPACLAAQPVDLLQRPRQAEKIRNYDVLNYRLVFRFDLPSKSFQGENTITLKPLQDGFTRCTLDAEDFTVTEVSDGRGGRLGFRQSEKELAVDMAAPAPYGLPLSFVVRFFMKEPKTGLKFIEASPRHPAQINTYSWPEDAHHWFPCNDYPNDKATDDMTVTVPAGFKAISNGRLIEAVEDDRSGTATYHWSQDRPHPVYGIMIAAGPYEIIRDSHGDLPVDYWVYPKDAADAPRSFHKTPGMIEFYEKTFGVPYPWAKYDQVCVAGYGGGMEATTATILGDTTIHNDRAESDFPSDGLVAHELAHMWWGDFVTPRRWTDVWISESFATYSEYLFSRFDRGEDEGALNLEDKKNQYLEEARTRYMRPIVFDRYNQPWEIMDGHSYPKGAAVLHMLRFVMGDGPFFTALRHFLDKFAYGIADTHDFAVAIKEATGQNLDGFLEQWLDHPGHPVFEVSSAWDAAAGKLKVTINQIQDFSRGIPVYRTPVAIGVADGRSRVSRTVWIEGKSQVFEFPCPSKPLDVIFDDGHHLLKELIFPKDFEELAFEIKNADAVGRMRAAVEIGRHPRGLPVLIDVSKTDPFWAVRRSAVETLGGLGRSVDIGVFKAGCGDPDSRVRAASVRALSTKPGLSAPADYFKALFRKDSSYVVQAAALKALGACGRLKDIPFLEEASKIESPRELLKKSAVRAIEDIRAAGKGR